MFKSNNFFSRYFERQRFEMNIRHRNPIKGKIHVNGVDLHYVEHGCGQAVVFVHSSLADYRYWQPHLDPFAERNRVIAYSRRYNYPNQNRNFLFNYSPEVDAADLAALIEVLGPMPVHLIGHAHGAAAALLLACQQPSLVRSLVLTEPSLLTWLIDVPEGPALYREQIEKLWQPVRQAFHQGDKETVVRITMDFFAGVGALERMPTEYRQILVQNLREWEALTTSVDAFPPLARERVKGLNRPLLLITGENSFRFTHLISAELKRLVPHSEHVTIPQAGHELWNEAPAYCREIIFNFLKQQ